MWTHVHVFLIVSRDEREKFTLCSVVGTCAVPQAGCKVLYASCVAAMICSVSAAMQLPRGCRITRPGCFRCIGVVLSKCCRNCCRNAVAQLLSQCCRTIAVAQLLSQCCRTLAVAVLSHNCCRSAVAQLLSQCCRTLAVAVLSHVCCRSAVAQLLFSANHGGARCRAEPGVGAVRRR